MLVSNVACTSANWRSPKRGCCDLWSVENNVAHVSVTLSQAMCQWQLVLWAMYVSLTHACPRKFLAAALKDGMITRAVQEKIVARGSWGIADIIIRDVNHLGIGASQVLGTISPLQLNFAYNLSDRFWKAYFGNETTLCTLTPAR